MKNKLKEQPEFIQHKEVSGMSAKEVEMELNGWFGNFKTQTNDQIRKHLCRNARSIDKKFFTRLLKLRARLDELRITEEFLRTKRDRYVFTESAPMDALGSSGSIEVQRVNENFLDVGGADMENANTGVTTFSDQGQRNVLNMSKFLSRPVELYRTTVAPGSGVSLDLPVWDLFTLEPTVRAKLRNFAYLKADMRVRISISGTPFHFGKIMVSYQPFGEHNPTLSNLLDMVALSDTFRPMLLNYLSQAPGSAIMNINENKPLELEIPFLFPKPMFRLFNAATTAISAVTSFDDCAHAGDVMIYSINNVAAINATSTPIQIQVYGWMENVELGTNTATHVAVTTESRFVDERDSGPLETVASSATRFLRSMTKVPIIGSYAKASSMITEGVGHMASLMGWSVPPQEQKTNFIKQLPVSNGVNTIGISSAPKICFDPKQELSINPQMMGSSEDEMTISHFTSRAAYLETFTWGDDDVAMTDVLYNCRVSPQLCTTNLVTSIRYFTPTPLAFASFPFSFWRGDITFRFEIVCSSFHRGKIAFYYEPNHNQIALIDAALSMNKQYMRVIDIQETQTVEFTINWASYREWLKLGTASNSYLNNSEPTSQVESIGYVNGYIGVVPFTALQSPDTSDVSINVYVYSDNMHFYGPDTVNMPDSRLVYTESKVVSCMTSQPVSNLDLNPSTAKLDHINEDHFGESVESFRSFLKRYMTTESFEIAGDTSALPKFYYAKRNIFPENGLPYAASSWTYKNIFSYLRYAYLGMRGGMRIRMIMNGSQAHTNFCDAFIGLATPATDAAQTTGVTSGYNAMTPYGKFQYRVTDSSAEAEFPMLTNNLFLFPPSDSYDFDTNLDVMEGKWYRVYDLTYDVNVTTATSNRFSVAHAIAEDFCFMRFQGCPFFSHNTV